MTHTTRRTTRTLITVLLLSCAAAFSVATSSSPPVIDAVSPGLGSSSVATDQPLEIQFERAVDPDSVTTDSVRLRRISDGTLIPGTLQVTGANRRVVFTPDTPLEDQTDYALELDLDDLTSEDGDTYVGLRYDTRSSDVWETTGVLSVDFTTRTTLRVARAFLLPDPRELLVYLSEPIDAETLTLATVSLSKDGAPVPIDLRYTDDDNRLRIIPLVDLDPEGQYTLQLDGAISTQAGTTLAAGAGEHLSFHGDTERIR